MRALNVNEIDSLVEALQVLVGARLQEVEVSKSGVGLGFWMKGQPLTWLWFENLTWSPLLLPLTECPQTGIKPLRPLALFLRAHFVNHMLRDIAREATLGRAVILHFSGAGGEIVIQLWPHGGNVMASAEGRRVTFLPVSEAPANTVVSEGEVRGLDVLITEWLSLKRPKGPEKKKSAAAPTAEEFKATELKRLGRAIEKVRAEITNKQGQPYREVGEWLVAHQSLKVPTEYRTFVDARRSLAWNIENSFHRAKEAARKLKTTMERLHDLERQMAQVESGRMPTKIQKAERGPRRKDDSGIKYRRVELSEKLEARIGKSAKDNQALLRQAKSWDLWLHLRDYPGSHAIIYRGRNENVGDEILKRVGAALIEQTFGEKAKAKAGEVFDVIVAECRFVKPIRGDKAGRVTFNNERTLRFRFSL